MLNHKPSKDVYIENIRSVVHYITMWHTNYHVNMEDSIITIKLITLCSTQGFSLEMSHISFGSCLDTVTSVVNCRLKGIIYFYL